MNKRNSGSGHADIFFRNQFVLSKHVVPVTNPNIFTNHLLFTLISNLIQFDLNFDHG